MVKKCGGSVTVYGVVVRVVRGIETRFSDNFVMNVMNAVEECHESCGDTAW